MINVVSVVPNVLTPQECGVLVSSLSSRCKSSTVRGGQNLSDVRNSLTTYVPRDNSKIDIIIEKIISIFRSVAIERYRFSINRFECPQYAEYTKGMFYEYHCDSGEDITHDRDLSASVFLSNATEYEGGRLQFKDSKMSAKEKIGDMVMFPSLLSHRVPMVTKGVRRSLVLWARRGLPEDSREVIIPEGLPSKLRGL